MACPNCGSDDVSEPKDRLNGVGICSNCGHQWADEENVELGPDLLKDDPDDWDHEMRERRAGR